MPPELLPPPLGPHPSLPPAPGGDPIALHRGEEGFAAPDGSFVVLFFNFFFFFLKGLSLLIFNFQFCFVLVVL